MSPSPLDTQLHQLGAALTSVTGTSNHVVSSYCVLSRNLSDLDKAAGLDCRTKEASRS